MANPEHRQKQIPEKMYVTEQQTAQPESPEKSMTAELKKEFEELAQECAEIAREREKTIGMGSLVALGGQEILQAVGAQVFFDALRKMKEEGGEVSLHRFVRLLDFTPKQILDRKRQRSDDGSVGTGESMAAALTGDRRMGRLIFLFEQMRQSRMKENVARKNPEWFEDDKNDPHVRPKYAEGVFFPRDETTLALIDRHIDLLEQTTTLADAIDETRQRVFIGALDRLFLYLDTPVFGSAEDRMMATSRSDRKEKNAAKKELARSPAFTRLIGLENNELNLLRTELTRTNENLSQLVLDRDQQTQKQANAARARIETAIHKLKEEIRKIEQQLEVKVLEAETSLLQDITKLTDTKVESVLSEQTISETVERVSGEVERGRKHTSEQATEQTQDLQNLLNSLRGLIQTL